MALRKVKGNFDRFFDKSLTDLIRGIRNNKDNEARYIAQCIEEIKAELKQDGMAIKANAIAKLSYMQMMGYDMSWASFNMVEVMASARFTDKRKGYLAASQTFDDTTDVLMLTTNLIRKDLHSSNLYDAGVSLGGLSCFVSSDLARDLANDVVTLLTSSRPYIRKRAVLLLYKIFLRYPDALRPTFPRLKEKLDDPDPGVQSAAVNVICELARKNPKNYLSLAPVFFKLMTSSSNNWMLIKIIKLFGALVPLEPRLGKKLLDPLTNLINSTSATSLLYECINTVIAVLISVSAGAPGDHSASIQLCVQKLGVLIEDTDQNLKYLGLLAMGRILQTHPKAVQAHKDVVLACLDDKDESIRVRALDLLYGMVSRRSLVEIVRKLMQHVDAAEGSAYRDQLLSRIIDICAHNNYQYITDFEWYVSVLVELTKVEGTRHGALIAAQLLDVAVRVQSIRHFAVSQVALLVDNAHVLLAGNAQQRSNRGEVLLAAAWICGEYHEHLQDSQAVLEAMLRTKVGLLAGHIQSCFIQNIVKLYAVQLAEAEKEDDWDVVASLDNLMLSKLPQFEQTDHLEAQERACSLLALIKEVEQMHDAHEAVADDLGVLFDGELNPIAPKAQRKIPVPPGLDLDAWINEPAAESSSSESDVDDAADGAKKTAFAFGQSYQAAEPEDRKTQEPSKAELKKMRDARQVEIENNPHYLKGSSKAQRPPRLSKKTSSEDSSATRRTSEATALDLQSPLEIPGVIGLDRYMEEQGRTMSWKKAARQKRKARKRGGRRRSSSGDEVAVVHEVNRDAGEMPDDAKSTDDEAERSSQLQNGEPEPFKALDVDLDEPLRDDEALHVPQHRLISPEPDKADSLKLADGRGDAEEISERRHRKEKPKREKKRREKRHRKRSADVPPPPPPVELPNEVAEAPHVAAANEDDLDFWLATSADAPVNAVHAEAAAVDADANGVTHQHKSKKRGGSKKEKRRGKKAADETPASLEVRDRAEYEVASGLCTPSKPDTDNSGSTTPQRPAPSPATVLPEMTSFRPLAENAAVRMTYETCVSLADAHQVAVIVVLASCGAKPLRRLELNLLDSLNARLVRDAATPAQVGTAGGLQSTVGAQEALRLPFALPPGVANEQRLLLAVDQLNVPQKLRGTLTYLVEDAEGSLPEKLDFNLRLPCVTFTVAASVGQDAFAEMLTSGDLAQKASTTFTSSAPLQALVTKLCFHGHFSVVEQAAASASLYSQTIQAHPLCVLLKQQGENVQLDGKSSDANLISSVISELKQVLDDTVC